MILAKGVREKSGVFNNSISFNNPPLISYRVTITQIELTLVSIKFPIKQSNITLVRYHRMKINSKIFHRWHSHSSYITTFHRTTLIFLRKVSSFEWLWIDKTGIYCALFPIHAWVIQYERRKSYLKMMTLTLDLCKINYIMRFAFIICFHRSV